MSTIKKLAGQTAIYGISSIFGRLLYFLLTPLYTDTSIFPQEDYGIVTNLFALMGFLLVVFTYRMELAYFRYGTEEGKSRSSFNTSLGSIVISTLFLAGFLAVLAPSVADLFEYGKYSHLLYFCIGIISFDALCEIPFARLRLEGRPVRFAIVRITGILINLGLNLFFILFCPFALGSDFWGPLHPLLDRLYDPDFGIGYIFLANLVASAVTFLLLTPQLRDFRLLIERALWKKMMAYSLPMVIVGFSYVINEMLDRALIPILGSGTMEENKVANGIYGANYKLAMILALFTQAFRYGAEPFFFKQKNILGAREVYAAVAKYFTLIGLLGFLGIMLYLDIARYFIGRKYWMGLHVVPILLMANLMLGLYYNLSVWYKLTDRTMWGAYISLGGAALTIVLNIWWIPIFGYTGCAWVTLICYTAMVVASFLAGKRYYPIPYPLTKMLVYLLLTLGIWQLSRWAYLDDFGWRMAVNTGLLLLWVFIIWKMESPSLKRTIGSALKK